jgi:hypothetical protein
MSAKGLIWIGIFVGSTVGSWIGAALDHGNWFGGWSIGLGAIGAFAGIWIGYKISQM